MDDRKVFAKKQKKKEKPKTLIETMRIFNWDMDTEFGSEKYAVLIGRKENQWKEYNYLTTNALGRLERRETTCP